MSSLPHISVVVPCHNRARFLEVMLRSLSWSAVPLSEFEVVVVDDGGADQVSEVTAGWRDRGLDVRVLRLDRPPGLRNNACARNAGLHAARYPIVIQTDPDIVFTSDVLASARSTLTPGVFLSCSGYYPLTRVSTEDVAFGPDGSSDVPGAYLAQALGRPNQVLSPDGVGGLHGAFVCWRADLLQAGGYDETFRYWGWEDRELIVTLEHRGLVRQTMADTPVVHLWHPPARGEIGRDEWARQGRVSRIAWDVQMQRASAEYARPLRPARATIPPVTTARSFEPAAYSEWRIDPHGPVGPVPLAYQLFFDAHYFEALALRSGGHVALARDFLLKARRCPWDTRSSDLARYRRVARVLEALAECEALLGNMAGYHEALALLESVDDGRAPAAAIRARTALREGRLDAACREAAMLESVPWDAARAALAIEIALLDGRDTDAWDLVTGAAADALASGDLFEQMRGIEYVRLIQRMQPSLRPGRVYEELELAAPGRDATELVFSAAMRSHRVGLDIAAILLFDRFIASPGRSEDRLTREAELARSTALARLERFSPWMVRHALQPRESVVAVSGLITVWKAGSAS